MKQETYKSAKFAQDGISDMDDLLQSLENSEQISFNITERGSETWHERRISSDAQDLFRTVLIEVATNYREKLINMFNNL